MSDLLAKLLAERDYLLADGATGTNMMAMGLPPGRAPDLWNVDAASSVTLLHESFLDVGSDIILTNTFGSNRHRLKLDKAEARVSEINEAGAQIACRARDGSGRSVVVAGSMGPTGELMEPHGMLTRMAAEDAFAEQAEALVRGGVDVLWIETIFAFDELAAATSAAAATGLPVASTMTFDTAGRTMMGDTPEKASEFIHRLSPPLIAYGANCGAGPAMLVETICSLGRSATRADVIIAKGNCGVPQTVNGEVVYSGDDETMARYARLVRDAGARIIGGCCGTTPERLRAIAHALDGYEPRGIPDRSLIESTLGATGVNGDKKRGRKRRPSRRHSSPGGAAPGRTRRSPDDE